MTSNNKVVRAILLAFTLRLFAKQRSAGAASLCALGTSGLMPILTALKLQLCSFLPLGAAGACDLVRVSVGHPSISV